MPVIADSVFHSRAIRTVGLAIEDDPEPMVQQQLARLKFMAEKLDLQGKRVLEFGCGTGLNVAFIQSQTGATDVAGFDISEGSVALAQQAYPQADLWVGDACDPSLNLSAGTWDVIVSFEVLEHVPDRAAFLANICRHLKPEGVVFLSTPNRDVFSSGHEPSPINREHIKELNASEIIDSMKPFFSSIELWGQQFKTPRLQEVWDDDVRAKIIQLNNGTRWKDPTANSLAKRTYNHLPSLIKAAWKYVRWNLVEGMKRYRSIAGRPYSWNDFEFTQELDRSLWFCCILQKNG